jgi:hypothetical protein
MRIYDLAVVEDCGTYWKINSVIQNTMEGLEENNELLIRLSFLAHEQIADAISSKKLVHIPKGNFRSVELLPGEFLIVEPGVDELQSHKDAVLVKIRSMVTPIITKISSMTMYGFIVLNNDLSSNGYFITNQNREEKYLEILETGDEKLIAKLEEYLNYKDEIENVAFIERMFSKLRADIKAVTSIDEVYKLEISFLENLKSSLK